MIPVLARSCVDRVKVLRGVEIHGDRRADLEAALVKLLSLWLAESDDIHRAALRAGWRHRFAPSVRDRLRVVVRERMGLTGPLREIPRSASQSLPEAIDDEDIREVLTELIGELPSRDLEPPILVELCLDLLRSSDFAEIEATDEELAHELQAALGDAPWTLDDSPRISLPSAPLLEASVRRFLEWLRRGGPPSEGPGGSCPPPAVPV